MAGSVEWKELLRVVDCERAFGDCSLEVLEEFRFSVVVRVCLRWLKKRGGGDTEVEKALATYCSKDWDFSKVAELREELFGVVNHCYTRGGFLVKTALRVAVPGKAEDIGCAIEMAYGLSGVIFYCILSLNHEIFKRKRVI